MERIRERSAITFSETDSLAIDVAANLIAIVALSIAIISPGLSLWDKILHFVIAPPSSRIILASLAVIGTGLVLYITVVILFQLVIGIVIQWFRVLRYRWFQQGHRYYYQMDMRLDAPIHADQAEKLFG